jgi:hypothetical protein
LGSTSTPRSTENEALALFKCTQGPSVGSVQTETSGRPWLALMFQSAGRRPFPKLAALNSTIANWDVRAWNVNTTMAQKKSSFFNEPLRTRREAVIFITIA